MLTDWLVVDELFHHWSVISGITDVFCPHSCLMKVL